MNHRAKTTRIRTFFIASLAGAALTLAGCSETPVGPSPDGVDLRGSTLGGEFTLTSNTGETIRWSDFDGRYRMIYFGFTFCPDICPTDVQRFSQGLAQFEKANPELAGKVQPIFVSVDPERDTVEVVDEFVRNFHPRLIGLTGTPKQIDQIKQSFSVTATRGTTDENGNYMVNHSTLTYLFGPDGSPLGVIPTDKMADGVAAELERWIR